MEEMSEIKEMFNIITMFGIYCTLGSLVHAIIEGIKAPFLL